MAASAAVFFVVALSLYTPPSFLTAPSVAAFPDTIAVACLVHYALARRRRFLIAAAGVLAIGIGVHMASLSLVPAVFAITALAGRRPWSDMAIAATVLTLVYGLTSSGALFTNLRALDLGAALPAVGGMLLASALVATFRPRFRSMARREQIVAIGVSLVSPFALVAIALSALTAHSVALFYVNPILAPVSVFLAAIFGFDRSPARRWLLFGLAGLALLPRSDGEVVPWSDQDAARIADRAVARGWGFDDLKFHVQSAACRELVLGMSMALPRLPPNAAKRTRQLQVMLAEGDDSPLVSADVERVDLAANRYALLREVESWLQVASLRVCHRPLSSGDPECMSASPRTSDSPGSGGSFLFANWAYPEIHSLEFRGPYVSSYEIPVAPRAGERRQIVLTDSAAAGCGWQITRVDGMRVDRVLPADRVVIESARGQPASIWIAKTFGTAACESERDRRYPPCLFESSPGDPIAILVEGRRY
ncbi:MAG TPA: hypothetical protein VEB21_01880 [Terriglobales bacterium]|nr:hypothetical protein [Terriglobales bacterium]